MAIVEWKNLESGEFMEDLLKLSGRVNDFGSLAQGFDPDMLYVECQKCGKPIVWDKGKTLALLLASGVNLTYLDWDCLILSDGCTMCSTDRKEGFVLSVVKVAGLSAEEAEYLSRPAGNA